MIKLLMQFTSALVLTGAMTLSAWAQTAEQALETVKQSVAVVLADLQVNKTQYQSNPALLNQLIDNKMVPYFDAEAMARLVLAKNWNEATPLQQQTFLDEFKQLMMRTYSSALLDYTDATVTYGVPTPIKRKRTKIDVTVTSNGTVYPLTLSMGYREGKWRAYDVALDGLSLITSYRSSVGEEVAEKGLQRVIDDIKALNIKGGVIEK